MVNTYLNVTFEDHRSNAPTLRPPRKDRVWSFILIEPLLGRTRLYETSPSFPRRQANPGGVIAQLSLTGSPCHGRELHVTRVCSCFPHVVQFPRLFMHLHAVFKCTRSWESVWSIKGNGSLKGLCLRSCFNGLCLSCNKGLCLSSY